MKIYFLSRSKDNGGAENCRRGYEITFHKYIYSSTSNYVRCVYMTELKPSPPLTKSVFHPER